MDAPEAPDPRLGLTRRFHVSDLLAVAAGRADMSPRGFEGVWAVVRYMTRYVPLRLDVEYRDAVYAALRGVLLAAYPEFEAFPAYDAPWSAELWPLWRRRRERELGRYLVAPRLAAAHPLLAGPARCAADDRVVPAGGIGPWYDVLPFDRARRARLARDAAAGLDQAEPTPDMAPTPTDAGGVGEREPPRMFPVGVVLAVVMGMPWLAPRGYGDAQALMTHLAGRPVDELEGFESPDAWRAALLAAHPALGNYTSDDAPPPELSAVWLRRREHELGRYLAVARWRAAHPLRVAPPRAARADEPEGGDAGAAGDER